MSTVLFPVGTTGSLVTAWKAVLPALGDQRKDPDFYRKLLVRVWAGRRVELTAHSRLVCFRTAVDMAPGDDLPPCETETVVHVNNPSAITAVLSEAYVNDNAIKLSVEQPGQLENSLFTAAGFDFDSLRLTTGTTDLVCPGSGVTPFVTGELFGGPPDPPSDGGFLVTQHSKAIIAAQREVGDLVAYPGNEVMWMVPQTSNGIEFEAVITCGIPDPDSE